MLGKIKHYSRFFSGSFIHPQWLSNKNHEAIRKLVLNIKKSKILNIGSGDTEYPSYFIETNSLVQLDYPTTNLLYHNKPHVFGDACSLPFEDGAFDVILILEVLEHIPDDISAIKEIHRTLKPNGILYLSTPFLYPIHDCPHDYRRYTRYGLINILSNTGFGNISCESLGNSYTTLLLLFNLNILNRLKNLDRFNKLALLIAIPIAYTACLSTNLLGAVISKLKDDDACMGYFVNAHKFSNRKTN